jgi:phosphoribosyl 1,2-cyclic phosphodiesterase
MSVIRFASLGSGSRGNATLVEAGRERVLIDCGFAVRETERRLGRLGIDAHELTAILVTHEHGDHVRGVGALARKYDLPVYASFGTRHAVEDSRQSFAGVRVHEVRPGKEFALGDLSVLPVPVPHDAREPCQYILCHGGRYFGVLTDTGSVTAHLVSAYQCCDALLLECNHDPEMLAHGAYHPALKQRVGGDLGHLNNGQARDFLKQLPHERLQHLVLSHLSEHNNTPQLALAAITAVWGNRELKVADQEAGFDWLDVV